MQSPVQEYLESLLRKIAPDDSGNVASYIPELADENPDQFGLCLATMDGNVYEVGDAQSEFTIQSISKPFTYGLALADHGTEAVRKKIDVEPSGDAFNEISLERGTGRPRNAMINAGALAASSLITGSSDGDRFERLRSTYSAYAGRELQLDEQVYESERRSGDRNRAIAYLLKNQGIIEEDVDAATELYFKQCSVNVTCRDLSIMAATLANQGVNPVTSERVLAPELVEHVLSVMTTCGMYNDAGTWVAEVGLPAKSGVSGGILAVLPGQIGIAVFSPRLDQHGNSVRGVATCRRLSSEMELHFMHVSRSARSAVRATFTLDQAPSRRLRTPKEQHILEEKGNKVRILELHGDMYFSGAESVARTVTELTGSLDLIVLDVSSVEDFSAVARRTFSKLQENIAASHCRSVVVDPDGILVSGNSRSRTSGGNRGAHSPQEDGGPAVFDGVDSATQWCEDWIITKYGEPTGGEGRLTLDEHPLAQELSPETVGILRDYLEQRDYDDGETIVARGAEPAGIFLVMSGKAHSTIPRDAGGTKTINVLTSGTSFGEVATMSGVPHVADVHADGETSLEVLTPHEYQRLRREVPEVALELAERLVQVASKLVDRATAALAAR
ncbi:glutaminase A [Arthrobacter monumenti]